MDDSEVLALLRAGVVVLDPSGTIARVGGGVGGVLGYEIDELVGRHAMELVAPSDRGEVAFMFSGAIDPIAEPLASPFALRVLNREGEVEVVDCLATGIPGPDGFSWVVTLTAREQQPVSYRALDCHLAGASVVEVAQCVARELTTSDGVRIEGFVLHHPARRPPERGPGGRSGLAPARAAHRVPPGPGGALERRGLGGGGAAGVGRRPSRCPWPPPPAAPGSSPSPPVSPPPTARRRSPSSSSGPTPWPCGARSAWRSTMRPRSCSWP